MNSQFYVHVTNNTKSTYNIPEAVNNAKKYFRRLFKLSDPCSTPCFVCRRRLDELAGGRVMTV